MPTTILEMNFYDGNIIKSFRKWRQILELTTFAEPFRQDGRAICNTWVLTEDKKAPPNNFRKVRRVL